MRRIFSVASLIVAVVFFALFMTVACTAYYLTHGQFISSELAAIYAALGLLGALSVVLRRYLFSILFYLGCALGWGAGLWVGTLKGSFAPTAGNIASVFLICCFSLIGFTLEIKGVRKRQKVRRQEKEAAREREAQAKAEAAAPPAAPVPAEQPAEVCEPAQSPGA